jgi:hypothetical protein
VTKGRALQTCQLNVDTEYDAVGAANEPRKLVAPLLDRAQTRVLAVQTEKIEGDEASLRPARLGAERPEVAPTVGTEHDRLAVDQRAVGDARGEPPCRTGSVAATPLERSP